MMILGHAMKGHFPGKFPRQLYFQVIGKFLPVSNVFEGDTYNAFDWSSLCIYRFHSIFQSDDLDERDFDELDRFIALVDLHNDAA